jgi:DNA-directed RNA polymerase specialized sigma24 family protein
MTTVGHHACWQDVYVSSMEAEATHLSETELSEPDWTRDPRQLLHERAHDFGSSIIGATTGAAARYAREYPHDEDPNLAIFAKLAGEVVARLPPRLHRFWELHYVEGQPLVTYAETVGLEMAAAHADYLDIRRELRRILDSVAARARQAA